MQTDLLLKHLNASLTELKTQIAAFEQQSTPNAIQAEALHTAVSASHKLISAYAILKENKEVANIDLHLKIMAVPTAIEKQEIKEQIIETKPIEATPIVKPIIETKTPEPIITKTVEKEFPKFTININDKFRMINELFLTNANEYNTAIEQLNEINSLHEATTYLKGLKDIYDWDDENEMVKKISSLTQKRFS